MKKLIILTFCLCSSFSLWSMDLANASTAIIVLNMTGKDASLQFPAEATLVKQSMTRDFGSQFFSFALELGEVKIINLGEEQVEQSIHYNLSGATSFRANMLKKTGPNTSDFDETEKIAIVAGATYNLTLDGEGNIAAILQTDSKVE